MVRLTASGFAAAALLTIHSPVALAQAPGAPTLDPRQTEPPKSLTLFDKQTLPPTPAGSGFESLFRGADVNCIGCPGGESIAAPPATNRNAPWVLRGSWQRKTRLGVASLGFVGVRNSALPPSTFLTLGGGVNDIARGSANATFFMPSTQWSLTAGLEKTLLKFSNGASVGLVGDVFMPVRGTSAVAGDPRSSGMKSTALRLGVVVRW